MTSSSSPAALSTECRFAVQVIQAALVTFGGIRQKQDYVKRKFLKYGNFISIYTFMTGECSYWWS